MTRTRALISAVVLALAALTGLASASATIPNTALPLSATGEDVNDPQVAVDPNGNAFYAWVRDQPGAGTLKFIQAVRVASNGTVGTVHTVSTTTENASSPAIAALPNGEGLVVWQEFQASSSDRVIRATEILANGTLGFQKIPISDADDDVTAPDVGADGSSNALIVWTNLSGSDSIEARSISGANAIGPIEDVSSVTGANMETPDLAVAPNGKAIVSYHRADAENVFIKPRSIDGAWANPGGLGFSVNTDAGAGVMDSPQIAIDPTGEADAVVTWREDTGPDVTTMARRIESDELIPSGPVRTLSAAGEDADQPQVDIDPSGNAYLVWRRSNGTVTVPQHRTMSATGSVLGTVANLNGAGTMNGDQPQVAVDGAGNAVFVWRFGLNIETRSLPFGGALTDIQPLTSSGSNTEPRVDANAVGARWGAYRVDTAGNDRAFGFFDVTPPGPVDTAAPVVTIVSGPDGPTTDRQPTFAFSSSEPGSFLCSIDGGPVDRCSSVDPFGGTYAPESPLPDGSHSITVTAFDAAHNEGNATRTFTVFTPVSAPPPARKKCKKGRKLKKGKCVKKKRKK